MSTFNSILAKHIENPCAPEKDCPFCLDELDDHPMPDLITDTSSDDEDSPARQDRFACQSGKCTFTHVCQDCRGPIYSKTKFKGRVMSGGLIPTVKIYRKIHRLSKVARHAWQRDVAPECKCPEDYSECGTCTDCRSSDGGSNF